MKQAIGAKTFLYPMPTVLVGALVNGKPNYMTVAYCGILGHQPPLIGFSSGARKHTTNGIEETGVFSVNIPNAGQVEVTDYCGITSGKKVDKSGLFTSFYGKLEKAPMIEECPLTLECKLLQQIKPGGSNIIFIGEIIEAYANQEILTNGLPDIQKLDPIVFSMHDNHYWRVGRQIGQAWHIGKDYKKG